MPGKRRQQGDDEKLRELIIYVSMLSQQDRNFGATKLNKLLFYTDFLAYQRFGTAITGQEYQALPQGPAPKRLKPIIERMKVAGDIKERWRATSKKRSGDPDAFVRFAPFRLERPIFRDSAGAKLI